MRAPLAPVKTRSAKHPPASRGRIEIDTEAGQEGQSFPGQYAGIPVEDEMPTTDHAVGHGDAEFAGEVIVTGPRPPHLVVDFRRRPKTRRTGHGDGHDRLQHLSDQRICQPIETAWPAL